jgi:plasmid stabilization system protein ParE
VDAIESLAQMPKRCALCFEHRHFKEEVRQLLYGKKPNVYRILFIVRAGIVHVLHIRHAARRELRRMSFPPK